MKIIEASELPEGEKVFLRKVRKGYKVIKPFKDISTGKIIWKNIFSSDGMFTTMLIVLIFLGNLYLFHQQTKAIIEYDDQLKEKCFPLLESVNLTDLVNGLRTKNNLSLKILRGEKN